MLVIKHGTRYPGIRALVIALAIASIVPGLIAGGLILVETQRVEERQAESLILETARAMRLRRPDIPILLVTGFAEALKPGEWPAEDILHKPFEPSALRERIQKIITRARNGFENHPGH